MRESAVAEKFFRALALRLQAEPFRLSPGALCAVAFSGGLDSTVLLEALTRVNLDLQIRALHVDHQLNSESGDWAARCARFSEERGIECRVIRVDAAGRRGESPEAAARRARYAALTGALHPGEMLLTAHHADDQMETLLYRQFRGTGVSGLQGIPELSPLGNGRLGRPLLRESRSSLEAVARASGLAWIEDPSNRDPRFDRNFIRQQVVPVIHSRWPAAADAAARLAYSAADARELAVTVAEADLARTGETDRLALAGLERLSPARQRNLLRYCIEASGLKTPSAERLEAIREGIAGELTGGKTCRWPGGQARVHAGALYLLPDLPAIDRGQSFRLVADSPLQLPVGKFQVSLGTGGLLPADWSLDSIAVRFRREGDQFLPPGAGRALGIGEWCRQRGIAPWLRDCVPLLERNGEIVAVADLAGSAAAQNAARQSGSWVLQWSDHPRLS